MLNRVYRLAASILCRHAFLLLVPVLALTPLRAHPQAPSDDLFDFSIEDLLELDVVTVGVLGSHTHLKGEWIVGYKFMVMSMEGNRVGAQQISTQDVLSSYMVSPLEMTMEMHMVELMFAPSDALTVMAMVPYHRRS